MDSNKFFEIIVVAGSSAFVLGGFIVFFLKRSISSWDKNIKKIDTISKDLSVIKKDIKYFSSHLKEISLNRDMIVRLDEKVNSIEVHLDNLLEQIDQLKVIEINKVKKKNGNR